MAIDRVGNKKLTPLNPRSPHHYVDEDPSRAVGASGLDVARQGCQTLDRGHPSEYGSGRRYGLSPRAPAVDSTESGDACFNEPILY